MDEGLAIILGEASDEVAAVEVVAPAAPVAETPAADAEVYWDVPADASPAADTPEVTETVFKVLGDAIGKTPEQLQGKTVQEVLDEVLEMASTRDQADRLVDNTLRKDPNFLALNNLVRNPDDDAVVAAELQVRSSAYPHLKGANAQEKMEYAKDIMDESEYKEFVKGIRGRHSEIHKATYDNAVNAAKAKIEQEAKSQADTMAAKMEELKVAAAEKVILGRKLPPIVQNIISTPAEQDAAFHAIANNPDLFMEMMIQFSPNPQMKALRAKLEEAKGRVVPAKAVEQIRNNVPQVGTQSSDGKKYASSLEEFLNHK